jgi:glyoxylase-like metal-dependent hydrolase (beta-lactamase superfamily II)
MPVQIDRFYLGCLAHASYLLSSKGVAAVIDPQRDVDIYVDAAAKAGLRIDHVILTHLHADFVSGHLELSERTGAKVYIGAGSGASFPHIDANDGGTVQFGDAQLEFRATPGHTLESISIVLTDTADPTKAPSVFTGDTLFIGDVGRPATRGAALQQPPHQAPYSARRN